MQKTISVLIPVFNREKYIEECIYSVLEQSYPHFEILVVDDGSTDQTLELCRHLAEKDSRIRLLAVEHIGVSGARNKAIDEATGDYLFFLDSDDVIHPLTLESLVTAAEEYQVSFAAVEGKDIPPTQWDTQIVKEIMNCSDLGKAVFYTGDQILERFFKNDAVLGRMGGILLSRDYVGKTRFCAELHIGEDRYFTYLNLLKGSNAVVVPNPGYYWRWHKTKLTWDLSFEGFLSRLHSNELIWKNEEMYGRTEYANILKRRILSIYISAHKRNKVGSESNRKTRKVMKQYRKILFPALTKAEKLQFCLAVYVPWGYFPVLSLLTKRQKKQSKD